MFQLIAIIISVLITFISSSSGHKYSHLSTDFENVQVNRTIDLTNHVIKIKSKILIKNLNYEPINTYRLPFLKNQTKGLLHLEAKMTAMLEEETSISLKIHKQQKTNENFIFYDLSFRSEPMNHEEERVLEITEYYAEQLELLPKQILITEDQYAIYQNTQNLVSYYDTLSQKTKIKLPVSKNKILTYTKENAVIDGEKLIYYIHEKTEPFAFKPFKIHYECNFSLVAFNTVEKIYEVSHWGNIAVEERYQIENIGAKLIGEFGRVDFDDQGVKGGKNALRSLYTKLPLRANNLWYRDEIGNVSSSKAFRDWEDVKVEFELRFPLLGGWKSNYNMGYSLPTKFHVSGGEERNFKLNLTFGLGYDDILARNYSYRIVLPEHASIDKVILPVESSNYKISYEKTYSFLDLFGRTTVLITMNNVFDIHRVPIQVSESLGYLLFFFSFF